MERRRALEPSAAMDRAVGQVQLVGRGWARPHRHRMPMLHHHRDAHHVCVWRRSARTLGRTRQVHEAGKSN